KTSTTIAPVTATLPATTKTVLRTSPMDLSPLRGQRVRGRGLGVDLGRVEDGHARIRRPEEEGDLGAAQDDPVRPVAHEVGDDPPVRGPRLLAHDPAVLRRRNQDPQAVPALQAPAVEVLLHGEAGGDEAHALEARGLDPLRG